MNDLTTEESYLPIIMAQTMILLKTKVTGVNIENQIQEIKQCILSFYSENKKMSSNDLINLFERNLRFQIEQNQTYAYYNPESEIINRFTYTELITKIMFRILNSPNRNDLAYRMFEEVNECTGCCYTFKLKHLMNIFTGFPEFFVDTRTVNEKIKDYISEINNEETSYEMKELRLWNVLHKLKVPYTEQQHLVRVFREVNA